MSRCVVVDMASSSEAILGDLKDNDIHTVFRYYASGFQPSLPEKRLTRSEADALLDGGFSIGVVYQFNNNQFANMNAARGRSDAEFAIEYAQSEMDQPEGSAIYFGVDGDWWTNSQQERVEEYFEAINEVFADNGNPYLIGVYGSGKTCQNLGTANLASLFWLPLSTGWSLTREYFNSGEWSFYQNYHGLNIGGRYTDTNIINPAVNFIGTYNANGVVTAVSQPPSVFSDRRFVEASALNLRKQPDQSSAKIGSLRNRQNVRVLEDLGDWVRVDVNEDGIADGYCSASYLVSLEQMP
ncbi:MAG: glycoside hydrolase domain-containing protein [Rhizobiaceae bacterium]